MGSRVRVPSAPLTWGKIIFPFFMRYTVYILQSQVDNTFYIGYTSNLERRLSEHNEGRTRYSSSKRPWELLYSEEYTTKRDAIMRERFLKKQKNKAFYLSLKGWLTNARFYIGLSSRVLGTGSSPVRTAPTPSKPIDIQWVLSFLPQNPPLYIAS